VDRLVAIRGKLRLPLPPLKQGRRIDYRTGMEASMDEYGWIYATAGLMVGTMAVQLVRGKFDPFAPVWLFFVGYVQIYVVQALSYHDWAVKVRGEELVTEANFRAFAALAWFLAVYFLGPTRLLARLLPKPPARWGTTPVAFMTPFLIAWGLVSAGLLVSRGEGEPSAEAALFASFPLFMIIAGGLLLVTGRQPGFKRPGYEASGIAICLAYMVIWMFNGKRSHSLIAVLVGLSSYYLPRFRRPSYPVLMATGLAGALAVGIAIGWRYHSVKNPTQSTFSGFLDFVSTFDPETILESINVKENEATAKVMKTHETEEWGGYLLMLATVPDKSDYDYGAPYLRVFTTFIPRLVWPSKPLPGREQWVAAWIAGSELKRDSTFTGPAIGILGAAQLNGGIWGMAIVLGVWALIVRTAHDYAMLHAHVPWAQAFWSLTYYNAWFSTVCDDPLNWFYYSYGFTTLPTMTFLWFVNKFAGPAEGPSCA